MIAAIETSTLLGLRDPKIPANLSRQKAVDLSMSRHGARLAIGWIPVHGMATALAE
jgi:hypothetical protein